MDHAGGASILIVEDERIVAKDIQQTLLDLGYDAFAIASSAEEAISYASQRCPDLVLMDIRIQGEHDGIEAAEMLRSQFHVPIVYLTANADAGTVERAKKTEPYGYLKKPVRSADLRSVVEVSLHKHEAEKRLRESEHWFSTTFRSIADAVITVDVLGNVTFMNPAAEALTGTRAEDGCGKPIVEALHLVDEYESGRELPVLTSLREGRSIALEEANLLNLSTREVRIVNHSAARVADESNQTLGAVMVFGDITEQKKLQKQLELTDRLASLGTMAAGVAHEINNPLAIVVANAGFLIDELSDLKSRALFAKALSAKTDERLTGMTEAAADLQSASSRIARIVSDLSVLSRPPPGMNGNADIIRCIEWAIRTTSHEFRQRAHLVTQLGVVPRVTGDEARLGQVVINLLMNATQAISPGNADQNQVTISTSTDARGRVVLEVRDTGVGIPKDILNRIMDPFFTTKPVGVGTGLGLSICHGILSSVGGEMRVESELGKGTVVRVLLEPALPEEASSERAKAEPKSGLRGRILIIDDEELVLEALRRILRNHEVHCVSSAGDALILIDRGEHFDVILSDVMMPRMTGIEFYEKLQRARPEMAGRVIFLTGAIAPRVEDFLKSIPNLQITKPFDIDLLHDTIARVLAQQSELKAASDKSHDCPNRSGRLTNGSMAR